jgi:hypothetical protein
MRPRPIAFLCRLILERHEHWRRQGEAYVRHRTAVLEAKPRALEAERRPPGQRAG